MVGFVSCIAKFVYFCCACVLYPVVTVQRWVGRMCGPNSEGGSEENGRIIGSENCKVPVQISCHTADN